MMFLMYGVVVMALMVLPPTLLIQYYRAQGTIGMLKALLVLVGVVSGGMWLLMRAMETGALEASGSPQALALQLSEMPWGTIWIIDTMLIGLMVAYFAMQASDSREVKP